MNRVGKLSTTLSMGRVGKLSTTLSYGSRCMGTKRFVVIPTDLY
ncbi:hypothetical protein [Leptospira interrogans]|nr:hypothetical protein [Leptospira interrogans]